ncbi:DUF7146 domain-containing protein [Taklimakanibacter deserti]|uniref:DUF7146 domain-containing protein n=1 Tax=Taklimakanibacter deserti TaxID=2267839 RepID=UPI0034D7366E
MLRADAIARALGGRKVGSRWIAPCPAHRDHQPSLSLTDLEGKVLVHCFAGCAQNAVIDALRRMGLWKRQALGPSHCFRRAVPEPLLHLDFSESPAYRIWQSSVVAEGTLVKTYLRTRGIDFVAHGLRFHPRLKHPTGTLWPAMVALVTWGIDGFPIGIHRTFLAHDGHGKAPIEPSKMMLGPCRGGAVRLGEPTHLLMVGEGIETCMSVVQATRLPVWAALSASGLRTIEIPKNIEDLIVLSDGDLAGETAARACAERWTCEGRRVRIARPPIGQDFNDILMRSQ